ncbi:MAG: hypothetical protein HYZ25_05340 [Chloroflexi bacterium]|nr:hypothetical protein [Chloroflexota bacterium]
MKEKNSYLPLIYLVLGCLGVISVLAIFTPNIQRHSRNIDVLSSGIEVNIKNHDEKLAEFNIQALELEKNALMSSITRATIFAITITGWFFIKIAIMCIPENKKQRDISNKTIETQ